MSKAFGRRLRVLRISRGWSMAELEKRSGVSRHTIVYVEAGVQHPYSRTIYKLARGLDVPVDELLSTEVR